MSRTKYRADVIDDLMNRVRQHHEAWDAADAQVKDTVEVDRSRRRVPFEAPPRPIDKEQQLDRAYDANMRAANWAPSEGQMFGRKGTPKYKVIQSGESRMEPRLPPETPFGQAGLPKPKERARGEQMPGWLRYQITLQRALDEIDRARNAYAKPLTRGAVAAMSPQPPRAPAPVAAAPTKRGDDVFERPEPAALPAEPTNPNFHYDTQQMFFWQLAPSDRSVVGGTGAEWAAGDAEITKTHVAEKFGRPR